MSDDDWSGMPSMFQMARPKVWNRLSGTAYEVLLGGTGSAKTRSAARPTYVSSLEWKARMDARPFWPPMYLTRARHRCGLERSWSGRRRERDRPVLP